VPVFTSDAKEMDFLWKVRKGLFPAVGAVRASGTTVILEDIAFPVDRLGDAIVGLQQLFKQFGYTNAIIFGHAKDGNIHFVVTQSFGNQAEITRYDQFMRAVVELVVEKFNGTLKAEHGTGRNMAPFVETEWGSEAYAIMKRIKHAADPLELLNPGVIINDDNNIHIKNLKALPPVEEEVDKCIECGYCEHTCPSRDLTATPRRRIVIRRALQQLAMAGDHDKHKLLLSQSKYDVLDTCAVDGLCATACPVDINTGDLVKRLRAENHSPSANKTALLVAKNFKTVVWFARVGLQLGTGINKLFGKNTMPAITKGLRKLTKAVPLWSAQITAPPKLSVLKVKRRQGSSKQSVVYFPSCISKMLGTYPGKRKNIMEAFISVCEKANINVIVPGQQQSACCGQIFSSKGFKDAYYYTANKIVEQLWQSSSGGQYLIVIDVSSCAYTLHNLRPVLSEENKQRFAQLTILDSVDFLHDTIMPLAKVLHKKNTIVLHPVCSLEKMKSGAKFIALAKYFAEDVTVPKYAGCCGMAGDRGFLLPQLTASATLAEALEVKQQAYTQYYSSTKTCEMAMSQAVGANYESILYLVDEAM